MTDTQKQQNTEKFKPSIRKHESFALRKGWLHKGIRRVKDDSRLFTRSSEDANKACDILGIGANMVKALRYWLKATQVMSEDPKTHEQKISEVGTIIDTNDRYFEERGTNYIIHYLLASNKNEATAWYWFFNIHRGSTIDKAQFVENFSEYCHIIGDSDFTPNPKVLESEFSCLIHTYCRKVGKKEKNEQDSSADDPEETKVCPLTDLHLIALCEKRSGEEKSDDTYKKVMPDKDDIHPYIAYAVICNKQKELDTDEIQISELLNGENNIGKVFNLDRSTVFYIIEKMERLGLIKITRTAGLDVIKVKRKMSFEDCLLAYYKTLNGEAIDD
jgi:hypothetical protein